MHTSPAVNASVSYETKSLDRTRERTLHYYCGRNSLGFNTLDQNYTNTPFQATLFWNNLVYNFRNRIEIKQKRVRLKCFNSCFSGSEAVTFVYDYLRHQRNQTNNKPISRENALKVCKLLLRTQVIEPVNISKQVFEDSSSKLYRVTSLDDVPWCESFGTHVASRKPQTEVLRPKNEHNLTKHDQKKVETCVKTAFSERSGGNKSHLPSQEFKKLIKPSVFSHFLRSGRCMEEDGFSSSDEELANSHSRPNEGRKMKIESSSTKNDDNRCPASSDDSAKHSSSDHVTSLTSLPGSSSSAAHSAFSTTSSKSSSVHPPTTSSSSSSGFSEDVRILKGKQVDDLSIRGPQTSSQFCHLGASDPCEDPVARQAILTRLLGMVDLPFLENFVHPTGSGKGRSMTLPSKGRLESISRKSLSGSNCLLLLLKKATESESSIEEVWWTVSIKLLSLLSKSETTQDGVSSRRVGLFSIGALRNKRNCLIGLHCLEGRESDVSLDRTGDVKSRVFSTIVAEHRAAPEPLWPAGQDDLHLQILDLVASGKRREAGLASLLSLHLLPQDKRDHVLHLLLFVRLCKMDAAFDCKKMLEGGSVSTTISRQVLDKISLETCFDGCIIRSGLLTTEQSSRLLAFMTGNLEELCSPLDDVEDSIRRAVDGARGFEHLPETMTFCRRVSPAEYERQRGQGTEDNLVLLMNHVIDSTDLSLKEKKFRLARFAKHHTVLYDKYFKGVL